jgi:hypothetical protein
VTASFWQRKLASPHTAPPATASQRAWWRDPEPSPQPSLPQSLAVTNYRQADQAMESRIANDGYLHQPPKWVREQATDRCPNCNGVNYAQVSGSGGSGQYGGLVSIGGKGSAQQALVFKRCFDCGFSPYRGLSDAQTANRARMPHGGAATATRQTESGGGSLHNFNPREVIGHV